MITFNHQSLSIKLVFFSILSIKNTKCKRISFAFDKFVNMTNTNLQQNHSPVSKTKTGRTPLHEVCVGGHKDCLRVLLQYTPEVNIRDRDGQTPAHVAAFNGELGCIKMLQDKGLDSMTFRSFICQKHHTPVYLFLSWIQNPKVKENVRIFYLHCIHVLAIQHEIGRAHV